MSEGNDWYQNPPNWRETEQLLYDLMIGGDSDIGRDLYVQEVFDTAYFNKYAAREQKRLARIELQSYMLRVYNIDFQRTFQWVNYKEWYDRNH